MKKIIYSLVIMIAAGSLFTSCIDQVEPVGILDMRTAKAEYIRALKDLRAADAEYRRAEAAVQLANAAYRQAETAWMQEQVNNQKLLNELQALYNEAKAMDNELKAAEVANEIDKIEKKMAERELSHAANMVDLEKALAEAQEELRVALRDIALASQSLTAEETAAVVAAVGAYELAYEAVAKQSVEVFEAQQALDKAKAAMDTVNDVYAPDTYQYENTLAFYNRKLEEAKATAAVSAVALAAIGYDIEGAGADSSNIIIPEDLAEWKAEIKAFDDEANALEYSKNEIVKEISNYYVNYVHDGWKTYNNAVDAWVKENPSKTNPGNKAPEYTEGQTSYTTMMPVKIENVNYPAGTTVGAGDTIEFPILKVKNTPTYAKFLSMLYPYTVAQINTVDGQPWKPQGEEVILMELDGSNQLSIYADLSFEDYILGDEDGTVGSQEYTLSDDKGKDTVVLKADYGLVGAVSVLERKMVTEEEEAENYKDSVEKYQKIWKADRDTLAAVFGYYPTWDKLTTAQKEAIDKYHTSTGYLTKYEPYATAIAAYATAKEAYDAEVQAVKDQKTNLIGAVKTLKAEFDKVNGKTDITYNDSLAIFNALKDFAAKREAYLEYSYKAGQQHDSTKFYYGAAVDSKGKVVKGVVAISELTFNELRDGTYDCDTTVSGGILDKFAAKNSGLAGMAKQILSDKFGTAIGSDPMSFGADYVAVGGADAFKEDGNRALYNNFYVDNFLNPTKVIVAATGEEYEKTVSTTELDKAEAAVIAAIAAYEDVYERYWGLNDGSYPGIDNEEDPECYVAETFTEPFCLANFEGNNLLWTAGLGAALASVDPCGDNSSDPQGLGFEAFGYVDGSYIFGTETESDFWWYMYYQDKIDLIDAQDLATIKEWVELVEMAFALSEGVDEVVVYAFYQADSAAFAKAKTDYNNYQTKLKEFTGKKSNGAAKGLKKVKEYSTLEKFFAPDTMAMALSELVKYDAIYGWTATWNADLGGTQLENAKTIFPELPEKVVEWQTALDEINDKISHANILKDAYDAAYVAAAAAKYEIDAAAGDDLKKVIGKLQRKISDAFKPVYDAYAQAAIGVGDEMSDIEFYTRSIHDFESEVPAFELAIAKAERDLAIATSRLQLLQQALDYAKVNLDRILEYVKSLDANYINIPGVVDVDPATLSGLFD